MPIIFLIIHLFPQDNYKDTPWKQQILIFEKLEANILWDFLCFLVFPISFSVLVKDLESKKKKSPESSPTEASLLLSRNLRHQKENLHKDHLKCYSWRRCHSELSSDIWKAIYNFKWQSRRSNVNISPAVKSQLPGSQVFSLFIIPSQPLISRGGDWSGGQQTCYI